MKHIIAFIVALSVMAPAISAAEYNRGITFVLADQDKNQMLSRGEFRRFINLLADAGHRNAKRVKTFGLYSLAWSRVDQNGDGAATRSELLTIKSSYKRKKS